MFSWVVFERFLEGRKRRRRHVAPLPCLRVFIENWIYIGEIF
jgi:hypothetical protein